MALRISNVTLQNSISQAIAAGQQKVMKLQQGMADGLAIHVPSDDPVGTALTMQYQEQVRSDAQYSRNIDSAVSQLTTRESALQQLQDLMTQVNTLQTSGATDATGASGRAALASQVNQALESMVELANSTDGNSYIFGGSDANQAPVVVTRDATGQITQISLSPKGVTGAWTRSVAPNTTLTLQANATDLFGKGASLFQQVISLRNALSSNDGTTVRSLSGALTQGSDTLSLSTTEVGSLINRATAMKDSLSQASTLADQNRSQVQDLSTAQAAVDYQSAQNALQAALQSGSQILQMSLLNYL